MGRFADLRQLVTRICFALPAIFCIAGITGCTNGILFRNKEAEAHYKAEYKRTHSPLIKLTPDSNHVVRDYRLDVDDVVSMQFVNFSREMMATIMEYAGASIASTAAPIGATSLPSSQPISSVGNAPINFTIDQRGYLTIPYVGRLFVKNMRLIELREALEKKFEAFVKEPIIELRVTNLRVFVYGEVSRPGVVILPEEHAHLTEVLAIAGGIPNSGKAYRIQLIRGTNKPQIYWIDYQQLGVLAYNELYVQPNDIIYVEPRAGFQISRELIPYVSLIGIGASLITTILFFIVSAQPR
jgi:protein involved in polysaccharide export with SLBB domain